MVGKATTTSSMDHTSVGPRDALRALQDAQASMRSLRARRQALLKELEHNRSQFPEAREAQDDAIIMYSQSCMRSFTEEMHAKLPRELRDMVYAYLWEPTIEYAVYSLSGGYYYAVERDSFSHMMLPGFALPAYSGALVANEAFSYLLEVAFNKHPLTTPFKTASEALSMDLLLRGFQAVNRVNTLKIYWKETVGLMGHEPPRKGPFEASCQKLTSVNFPAPIEITLQIFADEGNRIGECVSVRLLAFKSVYTAWLAKGHKVNVELVRPRCVDLTWFYIMDTETWLRKMDCIVPRWSGPGWSIDEYRQLFLP